MQWQRTNDNETDGADKRHRKWGIGLCALGVIYYFTVYPDLLEQVALTLQKNFQLALWTILYNGTDIRNADSST